MGKGEGGGRRGKERRREGEGKGGRREERRRKEERREERRRELHPVSESRAGRQIVGVAHSFCEVWLLVAGVLAELDTLAGFAELSVNAPMPFVRPEVMARPSP